MAIADWKERLVNEASDREVAENVARAVSAFFATDSG